MALMKWEPFREFEKVFDKFPFITFPKEYKQLLDLPVDLYEEEGNLIAEMNLPGVTPEQVEVTFHNGNLKIFGKRSEEKEVKEKDFYQKEIRRGEFERLIELPMEVKTEKTEAHFKNGVLKVVMPLKETIKKQKVKVQIQ